MNWVKPREADCLLAIFLPSGNKDLRFFHSFCLIGTWMAAASARSWEPFRRLPGDAGEVGIAKFCADQFQWISHKLVAQIFPRRSLSAVSHPQPAALEFQRWVGAGGENGRTAGLQPKTQRCKLKKCRPCKVLTTWEKIVKNWSDRNKDHFKTFCSRRHCTHHTIILDEDLHSPHQLRWKTIRWWCSLKQWLATCRLEPVA